MGAWRSSRPTIRARWRCAGSAIATCCACRRSVRSRAHEVRFARAIGSVLESRYRAILNPQLMVERAGTLPRRHRGSLRRRVLRRHAVLAAADGGRSERVAEVLEMLRVAALSSYENQPISTGVLLLEGDADPIGAYPAAERDWPHYTGALTSIKSFFRLADGLRTVFLVARDGRLLDIVDVGRWGWASMGPDDVDVPCARAYTAHAAATRSGRHVCIVLSPSREIKVFAEGAQVFTFRNADWHLLDLQAKYAMWAAAVGQPALARRLFQTALDLADAREGALFVVLRRPLESLRRARRRSGSARHGAGRPAVRPGHAVAPPPAARAGGPHA